MPIIVFCKECAKKIRVSDGPLGRFGRCPQCKARVAIPAESEAAPPKLKAQPVAVNAGALPEDAPTPPEAHEAVQAAPPVEAQKPVAANKPTAESPPHAAAAEKPKPETSPGKPPARLPTGKPARIVLDLGKLEEAVPQEASSADAHAKAKGSFVVAQQDAIKWDTSPDPPPSRLPWVLAFLAGAALIGGVTWWLWKSGESAQPRTAPEERKRQQFQLPAEKDEYDRLRESIPGEEKTAKEPKKSQ